MVSGLTVATMQAPISSGATPALSSACPGGGGAQAVVALGLTVVPPADAGTAADPRVVGIHDLGQIIIGHYMGRDTPAHAL